MRHLPPVSCIAQSIPAMAFAQPLPRSTVIETRHEAHPVFSHPKQWQCNTTGASTEDKGLCSDAALGWMGGGRMRAKCACSIELPDRGVRALLEGKTGG